MSQGLHEVSPQRIDQATVEKVRAMRARASDRDYRMNQMRLVRTNHLEMIAPNIVSEDWPRPIVGNAIDTMARDFAESIGILPTLDCGASAMQNDRAKKKASLKNHIGHYYWHMSRLADQLPLAADWFLSYGFVPLYVEADFDWGFPKMTFDDPWWSYYELDRRKCTKYYAKIWLEQGSVLASMFPELASFFFNQDNIRKFTVTGPGGTGYWEVIRFSDASRTVLYLYRAGTVLAECENFSRKCPVVIAERPTLDGEAIGQFDGAIWPLMAKAKMHLLGLDATEKAVYAPLVAPRDMTDLSLGPDSVWYTENPQAVRRVPLEISPSLFQTSASLGNETVVAARYSDARSGEVDASIITGKGVQALMGTFDTQIATAQTIMGRMLREATSIAFEIDKTAFPDSRKRIAGTGAGETYDEYYTPSKDIDNTVCEVTYGFAAGMNPSQAIVTMLQLRGDGLIDRDTVRRQLPFPVDAFDVQRKLDVQELDDALKQGLAQMAGGIGVLASQGMDPTQVILPLAQVIKERRTSSDTLEDIVLAAFKPPAPPPGQEQTPADQTADQAGAPGAPDQTDLGNGSQWRTAPGQAQMGPGGRPDLMTFLAGLRSGGQPTSSVAVRRVQPTTG